MPDAASLLRSFPLQQPDGSPDPRVLAIEIHHGRANEMGRAEVIERFETYGQQSTSE